MTEAEIISALADKERQRNELVRSIKAEHTKRIVEVLEGLMKETEPEKRYFTDGGWQAALYKAIERIKGLDN